MASGSDTPELGGEPSRPPLQTPQPPQNPQYDFSYLYRETPKQQTPDERAPNLREKIFAVIGYASCLLTGMMHVEYILQAFHVVPRSLHNTHWEEYSCFRDAIGIVGVDGKRVLNLNNSRNVDMASSGLHKFFDGPSVLKDKLGQGEFALLPANLEQEVDYITAPENQGKDYEELYPDVAHKLAVYGFSNKHKFSWGRYPSPDRTYEHLDPEKRTLLEDYVDSLLAKIDIHGLKESMKRKGVYIGSFAPPPTSDADPTIHILRAGRNYTVVSHINPVFAIYDYLLKMKFRVYDKASDPSYIKDIPPEDVDYFRNVMWPKLQHWVIPRDDAHRLAIAQSKRQHPMKLRKTTKKAATAGAGTGGAPAPRMAPPLAQRAVTHDGLVPTSPLTPLSSSPTPAERTTTHSPAAGAQSSIMGTLTSAAMTPSSPVDDPEGDAASFDPGQPMTVRITSSNPCYSDPPDYDFDDGAPEDDALGDLEEDEHSDDEGNEPEDYENFFDEEVPSASTPTASAGSTHEETTPTPAQISRELSTASVTEALADFALSGDPLNANTPQPDPAHEPPVTSTSSISGSTPPDEEEPSKDVHQGDTVSAAPPMTAMTPQATQATSTPGNNSSQDAPPPPDTTGGPEIQKRPATRRRTRAAARASPTQNANATAAVQPPAASTSTSAPSDPPARNLRSRGKQTKRERDDDEEDDGDDAPEPPKAKRARKTKPKPKTKDMAPVKNKGKKKDDPDPSDDDEGPQAGPSKKGKGKGRA
ncbi:uncharacterized protein SCHCODRAFT_02743652 [Schizophyllum commune H4-8]|nr:uncharacterized protein SCHCODRAFT_02743652 [Schizophyllum commune H4-8]KAI5900774.1 hypothetical protein SCHCODRAFT_02743652 [Schizophyllum commune H4-8]